MPLILLPAPAHAHGPEPSPGESLWLAWNWDPLTLIPLLLLVWLYARGVSHLWRRAGRRVIRPWRVACFAAGCASLAAAIVSPLDAAAERLFSIHMIQHMLIMGIAAPLLVLGRPPIALLWALSPRRRAGVGAFVRASGARAAWRLFTRSDVAWSVQLIVMWGWHAPALYDAAVRNDALHWLEHLTMLSAAYLFWYALIVIGAGRSWSYGGSALAALTTLAHAGMLGALLTFAPEPLYDSHLHTSAAWGLTPLEDQQLAGLVMWVPACTVYLVAGIFFIAFALRELEQRETRRPEAPWIAAGTRREDIG